MLVLLSLGLAVGSLFLIQMGRETLRLRHSGPWDQMAYHRARTTQAYGYIVAGVIGLILAAVLI